jgi:hypothetical protein
MNEIVFCLSLAFLFMCLWAFKSLKELKKREKRLWNKGKCRCGRAWECFSLSTDSGRGYSCQACEKFIWITFRGIDESYRSTEKSL